MWDKIISFIYAVILHSLLVTIAFISTKQIELHIVPSPPEKIMQAIAINESQWPAAIKPNKSNKTQENKLSKAQQLKKQQIKKKVAKESQRLDSLFLQRKAEQQRLTKLKQQQLKELNALDLLKNQKIKQERLAAKVEKNTRLEVQRQSTQKELINEFIKNIQQKLDNSWKRPRGYYGGLSCLVEIHIKQGGQVDSVTIVQSSGNIVFDHSAIKAIRKASPLPVSDELFAMDELLDTNNFLQFRFHFRK